jgi:histone acetyltransferase (RNA polymerase elongator complex component)
MLKNMKKQQTESATPTKGKNRTVKVSDVLHHRIRVISVQRRIPMQHFIEQLLTVGLREKVYEKFESEKATA